MNEFVEGFIAIDLLDEKSEHLTQFMDRMYEEMAADPTWSDASPDELEESKTLMEKRFLCSVYQYVFFPHEMAAMYVMIAKVARWESLKILLGFSSAATFL